MRVAETTGEKASRERRRAATELRFEEEDKDMKRVELERER